MYIYYTHHRDGHGKLVLTELKLTSVHNRWQILWKNPKEDALFKLCNPLLKMPPIAMRSYDEVLKIWTYMETYGEQTLNKITTVTAAIGGVTQIAVPDLGALAAQIVFDPAKIPKHIRPEDFFYQQAPLTTPELTKEQAAQKLIAEFAVTDKKTYRLAALQYHPDRNGGDGSRMSELNMLWNLLQH